MVSTGLFRAFTPLRYGGLEMDPASFFQGIMRIAEADSAAAWIAGQLNVHSFEIALMSERMQDEFWGESPDPALPAPTPPSASSSTLTAATGSTAPGHFPAAWTTHSG